MRIFLILLICLGSYSLLEAQHLITGRVIDSLGNGLPSVRISELNNSKVWISDQEGYFELKTKYAEGTLYFEHLGFDKLIRSFADSSSNILVVLIPISTEIEEVNVYTGYQALPKERVTGSFDYIDNNMLHTRTGINIIERLEGLSPGLQFDNRRNQNNINIRGINTFSATMMEPLIILDNFPYHGNLDNINPNDIESVTILKDAAATSIWGARAGNGVIVLTSKKASGKDKVNVKFNNSFTLIDKPNLFYRQDMNASDFIEVERFLFDKKHYDNAYYGSALTKKRTVFSPLVNLFFAESEGLIGWESVEEAMGKYRQIDVRQEIMDVFYRKPFVQQYNISFDYKTDAISNRLSAGFDSQYGAQLGEKSNRLALQAITTIDIGENISLETKLGYTHKGNQGYLDIMNENYSVGGGKSWLYPYAKFLDESGQALPIERSYNMEYLQGLQSSPLLNWLYYPVSEIGSGLYTGGRNHIHGQVKLDYRLLEGLRLSVLYNFENEPQINESKYGEESYYTRNMINMFTQIDGEDVKRIVPFGSVKNTSSSLTKAYNIRGQATYRTQFKSIHSLDLLAGYEMSHRRANSHGFWVHGYDEDLMIAQSVDPLNTYPVYDGLTGNSLIPNAGNISFSYNTRRFISAYFNGGYTLDNKYIVNFSARKDGSNLFGVKTNERWTPLWSVGVSWLLHNELFLKQNSTINNLKFRATYGHSGNAGGQAAQLPIISYQKPGYGSITSLPRAIILSLSNPNLKWEDIRTVNVGVDFGLFNNVLDGAVEYYNKKSTDLLSNDRLDLTTGYASITRNVGEIDGRGIDVRMSVNYKLGNVRVSSGINYSYNNTKVSKFSGTNFRGSNYAENTGKSLSPVLDKQLYPVYSFKYQGLDENNGDPLGLLNGELSKDYTKLLADSIQYLNYHGTALPPNYGSFIQKVSWGDLSISFLIAFKFGHYFQKETIRYNSLFNSWITHSDYEKRWQKAGDENITTVPSMNYPANNNRDRFYAASSANILKGDLIRLQDVSIDYSYKRKARGKVFNTNVFIKVNNLGLLWTANKVNLDPDYIGIPPSCRYSFGLNFNF